MSATYSTYYFITERHGALWFAYIYRAGDTKNTAPPAKEFHSQIDEAAVQQQALRWIQMQEALA